MTPEARAREQIDNRLWQSGWTIQDLKQLNLTVASGVAVREFPTNTGPVDYALFIEGVPVGVVEARQELNKVQQKIYRIGSLRLLLFVAGVVGIIYFWIRLWICAMARL